MNRAACFDCRQRAGDKAPCTVLSCACGYTSSYCRACGGRKRARAEQDAHERDCIAARRRAERDKAISRLGTTLHLPDGTVIHYYLCIGCERASVMHYGQRCEKCSRDAQG